MKEMTTTFFNRWKKGKVIEEYLVSGYSDGIQGRIVIVCEQMQENIIRLTYRKKTVGYIIQTLEQLKSDQEVIEKVSCVYGLNYVFDLNKKPICTFTRKETRKLTNDESRDWKRVQLAYKKYKQTKESQIEILEMEFGKLNSENYEEVKRISEDRGYFETLNKLYREYHKLFESYVKKHGFNPWNYYHVS